MPIFSRRFVRRRAISLATSLSVMATSFALAQDPKHHHDARTVKDTAGHRFLFDSDLATSNMNRGMLITPAGYIDRDFSIMQHALSPIVSAMPSSSADAAQRAAN